MANKLWEDIQAQGPNLQAVVRHLYTTERPGIEAAAKFLRNDRPIAMVGVASAAYLCMPSETYFGQCGRFANVICASDAFYSLLPALRNANVVINSRSGETVEIVKLGRALVDEGIPFVTITNEPESTLASMSTYTIWANTRKDELVSINVVTGMMTATLVLAAAVTGELDDLRPQFEYLAGEMDGVVNRATRLAGDFHRLLGSVRPVYQIFRGHSAGAAYCGRLVLEEVSRTPAIAMEAAEFRQGPNEVIDERFGAVLYIPEGKQGELNLSLGEDILRSGGKVLLVGAVNRPAQHKNEMVFSIPSLPAALRPVLEVVPSQMLAYERARAQGYEPGEVRYISKVILTEEGIPNEGNT